jgi:hypothetical protein
MSAKDELQDTIDKRVEEAESKTTSDDEVVQIAWLASGIDIWHRSGGKHGLSPSDAVRYIISSVTRYTARQVAEAQRETEERMLIDLEMGYQIASSDGGIFSVEKYLEIRRQALKEAPKNYTQADIDGHGSDLWPEKVLTKQPQ